MLRISLHPDLPSTKIYSTSILWCWKLTKSMDTLSEDLPIRHLHCLRCSLTEPLFVAIIYNLSYSYAHKHRIRVFLWPHPDNVIKLKLYFYTIDVKPKPACVWELFSLGCWWDKYQVTGHIQSSSVRTGQDIVRTGAHQTMFFAMVDPVSSSTSSD